MKKLAIFALVIIVIASVFVGCTESYSAKAIPGPTQFAASDISSNGGLAIKAVSDGKSYLYYINGYAEQSGENVFGNAVKGSIVRAELDADGHVKYPADVEIIVPKNVYAPTSVSGSTTASGSSKSVTNKAAGVYTDGKYLYYTSPSTKKNSDGDYKTTEMMLMRTALNGTDTDQIAYFTHYNVLYTVYNGSLVYFDASAKELHRVNLSNMKDSKLDESVTSVVFADYSGSTLDNLFFYTKASDDEENPDYSVIYRASVDGSVESAKYLSGIDNEALRKEQIEETAVDKGFKYSLIDLKVVDGKAILIIDKTDSGSSALSQGLYTIEVTADSVYSTSDEIRLSTNAKSGNDDAYSAFRFIGSSVVIANTSSASYLLNKTSDGWKKVQRDNSDSYKLISSAVTVLDVKEEDGVQVIYFLTSAGKVQKMRAFTLSGGVASAYNGSLPVVDVITSLSVATSSFKAEYIDGNLYYINSNVQNYTYAYYFDTLTADAPVYNQEDAQNRFISIATDADMASILA